MKKVVNLIAGIGLISSVFATELSLSDLLDLKVVVASKRSEDLSKAPGIISVVSKSEIRGFGNRDLYDVLMKVPSFFDGHNQISPRSSLGARGDQVTTGNHILFLLNGRPVRRTYDSGDNGELLNLLPLASIERLEIIRGPGSVLYGSSAYNGVVNIVTTQSDEFNVTSQVTQAGTDDYEAFSHREELLLGYGDEDWSVNGSFNFMNTQGEEMAVPLPEGGRSRIAEDHNGYLGMMDARYKGFSFTGFHSQREMDVFQGYNIPESQGQQDRSFLNIGYEYEITEDASVSANYTLNHSEIGRTDDFNIVDFTNPTAAPTSKSATTSLVNTSNLIEVTGFLRLFEKMNIVVGGLAEQVQGQGEGVEEYTAINAEASPFAYPEITYGTYDDINYSLYAQIDYQVNDEWKLISGVQANKPQDIDWDFVPRAGIIFTPTDEIGVKALVGQAFRNSNPYQEDLRVSFVTPQATFPTVIAPIEQLKPEKITTYEAEIFHQSESMRFSASGYYSVHSDLITLAIDPQTRANYYTNADRLDVFGTDFTSKIQITDELIWDGIVSLVKTQGRPANTTDQMNFPEFKLQSGVRYNVIDGVEFSSWYSLVGPQANARIKELTDEFYLNYSDSITTMGFQGQTSALQRSTPNNLKLDEVLHQLDLNLGVEPGEWISVLEGLRINGGIRNAFDQVAFKDMGNPQTNPAFGGLHIQENNGREWYTQLWYEF